MRLHVARLLAWARSADFPMPAWPRTTSAAPRSGSVLVATSPQLEGVGGRYFEDCNEAQQLAADAPLNGPAGVAAYALDPDSAARLWELSLTALA
jgi:hypothetical protein